MPQASFPWPCSQLLKWKVTVIPASWDGLPASSTKRRCMWALRMGLAQGWRPRDTLSCPRPLSRSCTPGLRRAPTFWEGAERSRETPTPTAQTLLWKKDSALPFKKISFDQVEIYVLTKKYVESGALKNGCFSRTV